MEIKGKLTKKLKIEKGISKAGKEWQKQSILIEQNGEYNKEVVISFFGDKIKSLRDINEGSEVNVSINLSSREYNGKYYTQIDGWRFAKSGSDFNPQDFVTTDDNDMPF